ncbi:MAG: hypothetical protein QOG45_1541, partial [Chloroflexota bacterium]|nr:hypothetical protein [Chloroflexota bacterium]
MTGTGAAVRAQTAPGPCETPVPGARALVDGKQDALDAAGRSPGDVVVAEWAVHDDDNEVVRSTCVTLVVMTRLRECGTGAGRCRQISAGWLGAAAPSCDVSARAWRRGVVAVPRRRWHEGAWSSLQSRPRTDWDHMTAQSRIAEAGWTGMVAVSLICAILCVPKGSRVRSDTPDGQMDLADPFRRRPLCRTTDNGPPCPQPWLRAWSRALRQRVPDPPCGVAAQSSTPTRPASSRRPGRRPRSRR